MGIRNRPVGQGQGMGSVTFEIAPLEHNEGHPALAIDPFQPWRNEDVGILAGFGEQLGRVDNIDGQAVRQFGQAVILVAFADHGAISFGSSARIGSEPYFADKGVAPWIGKQQFSRNRCESNCATVL